MLARVVGHWLARARRLHKKREAKAGPARPATRSSSLPFSYRNAPPGLDGVSREALGPPTGPPLRSAIIERSRSAWEVRARCVPRTGKKKRTGVARRRVHLSTSRSLSSSGQNARLRALLHQTMVHPTPLPLSLTWLMGPYS